jgi:DNA-binding Lrp family transcriptional regulator
MVTAIVLINTEKSRINEVGEKISEMEGITEVFSVSGRFDLVVLIRLKKLDDLSDLITEKITKLEGIVKTESMVAFKVLSRFDLANMFDLGS